MKKKYLGFLAVLLLVSIFLGGCESLVRSSYQRFSAVQLEEGFGIWDFYGSLLNTKNTLKKDYNTLRRSNAYGYPELYNVLDSQEVLNELLTNSVAVYDLHDNNQARAFFEFDDKKDYVIERQGTSSTQYKINYIKNYSFNNIVNRDIEVDIILERIDFPVEMQLRVQKTQIKEENAIMFDSYSVAVPNPNAIEDLEIQINSESLEIVDDRVKEITLTTEYSGIGDVNFKATATKTIKQDDELIYKYEKSIELIGGYSIKVSVDYQKGQEVIEQTKTIPFFEKSNITTRISFNSLEGSLSWNITNKLSNADVNYIGEAYYQGARKFLLQESVLLTNEDLLNFENSYTSQLKIEGDVYHYKYVKGNSSFATLKNMNIFKVGVYDNEPQALVFQKTSVESMPEFKRHG